MKPIISTTDLDRIGAVIDTLDPIMAARAEIAQLRTELANATIVPDVEIAPQVVRVGSYCEVEELRSGQRMNLRLVMPDEAAPANGQWSVLSPLGVALIGFSEGMIIDWRMPGGMRRFLITRVAQ